ncbi:hypothetical protein F5146DRAFT_155720 [Armillaria mellea]|nr:hypothetical protein F5146DRAFT_155720 [Armillaria mellea]
MPKAPSNSRSHLKDEYRFNFGRNKGKKLSEVSYSYIVDFCIQEGVDKTRPDLRRALQSSLVYAHHLHEPRPLSLKERRHRVKAALPAPIWEEFVAALCLAQKCRSIIILSSEEEVQILERILTSDFVDLYAKRPTDMSLLNNPSSASMTALNNLFNEVKDVYSLPVPKEYDYDYDCDYEDEEEEEEEEEEVTEEKEQNDLWWATYDTDEAAWTWSDKLRQAILAAVKAVQKEHGDVGLRVARWAVRDKYAQTVDGIVYGRGDTKQCEWYDKSLEWLIDECLLEGRHLEPGMMFAD